jgi:hypothetical protein
MKTLPKLLLTLILLFAFALAHPFEGSGGVIQGQVDFEPNDTIPKAGVPTVAWLEYVKISGREINVEDCFCTLLFYQGQVSATAKPDATVRMQKNPRTGRMEGTVTFPKPGPYFLVMLGRPMPGKQIPAFIMNSIIVVDPK